MTSLWLMTVLLAQTPQIQANTIAQLAFRRGLRHRDDGQLGQSVGPFREAAAQLDMGPCTWCPALKFKAGNARFLAGDLPHAIAAYRRGLALDLADPKLRTALAYARDQVQYPPAPDLRPEREPWPPWLTLRHVGVYAFALYFAACVAVTRWRMTRRRRWLVVGGVLLSLAAVPAVGSALKWQRQRRDAAEPVGVVARDVPLRVGNGADYPPKLDVPLPRGCEVRRLCDRGGWVQVETAGGVVGWVPRDAFVTIQSGA